MNLYQVSRSMNSYYWYGHDIIKARTREEALAKYCARHPEAKSMCFILKANLLSNLSTRS